MNVWSQVEIPWGPGTQVDGEIKQSLRKLCVSNRQNSVNERMEWKVKHVYKHGRIDAGKITPQKQLKIVNKICIHKLARK